ncbi:uncharacterized protein LOC129572384 [Sitodiplosis mosellana]|uniref:uncharacterized protein LOC129572384 n=1 Tax=Sitodiplosis mosellana TaxID=263140 RepID=UPI002443834D|nr:uncharacterized protein LOC129572384 [Sitodiplosis mosellana]XP_055308306.1 uncharacterized protein LOC129572384 [Sitodiplosis mosellana]
METRARKRLKLAQKEEEHIEIETNVTEFMDMNDDVMYALFQRLPLADLCSISQTCQRLQQLSGKHFQRRYPNNRLDIEIFNWSTSGLDVKPAWEFRLQPNEQYAKAFAGYIRNVSVFMYNYETDPIDAFVYLKANCYANLRELVLYRIAGQSEKCGELIKTQLKTLESIKFENCCIRDIYSAFLKHSPALKQISIKEGRNQNGCVMDWTKHRYPQVKSFIYHSNNVVIENLEQFFLLNPQIANVMCSSMNLFRLLFRKAWHLDFLHLSFESEYKFYSIATELQTYCHQGYVKRLEMHFKNGWEPSRFAIGRVVELAPLAVWQGLHVKQVAKKINFPAALEKLQNLTVFSLGIDHMSKKLLQVMSRGLPNLKELHLESAWTSESICGFRFKQFIRPFALHSPNLQKIAIKGVTNTALITGNDIVTLDSLRKKIPNASVITIYLDYKLIQGANFIIPAHSLLLIKPFSQLTPDYRKIY